jgi:DNA mismatch endonuclease (patch repair protein)
MVDRIDKNNRSSLMAKIGSKDTKPELWLRSMLHRKGYRFRLHSKQLPGSPDIVLSKYRVALFVNGCFWHQHQNCKVAHMPKTRTAFWENKFSRNEKRDQKVLYQLKCLGWRSAVIWECGLKKAYRTNTVNHLLAWLHSGSEYFEMPVYDYLDVDE